MKDQRDHIFKKYDLHIQISFCLVTGDICRETQIGNFLIWDDSLLMRAGPAALSLP